MSKRKDRINKILALLEEAENIHLKDVAKQLDVSEMTIRRDLSLGSSPIQLLGGHIVLVNGNKHNPRYHLSEHEGVRLEEKKYIGQIAARLIENDDTVFFDCGSTIPHIIKYIPDTVRFTALCYSLNVFHLLQQKSNCETILCGGKFNDNNGVFSAIGSDTALDVIYPTKAFISAAGVSQKGMTCFNLNEVFWKKKALQNSNYKILVVDDSKFGETRSAYFGQISDIDLLITNKICDEYHELFDRLEIEVLT